MRLNWMYDPNMSLGLYNIQQACEAFYIKYRTVPDTIKIPYQGYVSFLSNCHLPIQSLERGKDYGMFIPVPGGYVELTILDPDEEIVSQHIPSGMLQTQMAMIVIESSKLDREFEKHVLKD